MVRFSLIFFLLFPGILLSQNTLSTGQWRDHLSYYSPFIIKAGGHKVYAATKQGVMVYNTADNSMSRITRINHLNDVDISTMAYAADKNLLMVAYENGNIDLLTSSGTVNLTDIKRANIVGDKAVYAIEMNNNLAYLACGFGIVVLDLQKLEVKDTYKFGPLGTAIKVNGLTFFNGKIYAATQQGLYTADLSNPFLSNYENWTRETGFTHENQPFNFITSFSGRVFANFDSGADTDKLYETTGNGWVPSGIPGIYELQGLSTTTDKIFFSNTYSTQVFDLNLNEVIRLDKNHIPGQFYYAKDATYMDGHYYMADRQQGLLKTVDLSVIDPISPNGPLTNNVFSLSASANKIYVATGAVNSAYNNGFKQDGIAIFDGKSWSTTDEVNDTTLKNSSDFLSATISPFDDNLAYISSWYAGLIELKNGRTTNIYNEFNSAIQETQGFTGSYRVADAAFDAAGNLWIANSNVTRNVVVKTVDNNWHSYAMNPDFGNAGNMIVPRIIVTSDNTKWMIRYRSGLYVFNENGTFDSGNDDNFRALSSVAGSGGLPSNDVYSLAEDLDGEVWVGTDKGFAIYYSPSGVFSADEVNANQPIIEQDGNFEKILETEKINSIAVDGGNRKWMATESSGVYLLSEDGTKQIQHFTAENSPLLSNEVFSIAINQQSGEVFFGTSKGIQSYQSDAVAGKEGMDEIGVFPNPVRPDHEGSIAMRGFVRDSDVKITDIAGNIVFKTRSLGGQASWDGKNLRGEKPSAGVYLVFATNADGTETSVGKILFAK